MPVKVKDILERLREDGWLPVSTEGSHRQFKHPTKPGRVTVAGRPSKDVSPGTYSSIKRQAGWNEQVSEQTGEEEEQEEE